MLQSRPFSGRLFYKPDFFLFYFYHWLFYFFYNLDLFGFHSYNFDLFGPIFILKLTFQDPGTLLDLYRVANPFCDPDLFFKGELFLDPIFSDNNTDLFLTTLTWFFILLNLILDFFTTLNFFWPFLRDTDRFQDLFQILSFQTTLTCPWYWSCYCDRDIFCDPGHCVTSLWPFSSCSLDLWVTSACTTDLFLDQLPYL